MNKVRIDASTALLMLALSLTAAAPARAACYTIYSPQNTVVYQSGEPPVDLSRTISSQMALRYPRHHLVMVNDSNACPLVLPRGRTTSQPLDSASGETLVDSPMFRDALPMLSSSVISGSGSAGHGSVPVMNSNRGVPGTDGSARPSMRSGTSFGR